MICIKNFIMANTHLRKFLITRIATVIVLLVDLTTLVYFMPSDGVGQIWSRIKLIQQTQEAKMTILKLIRFRDKSVKTHKPNNIIKLKIGEVGSSQVIIQDERKGSERVLGGISTR